MRRNMLTGRVWFKHVPQGLQRLNIVQLLHDLAQRLVNINTGLLVTESTESTYVFAVRDTCQVL